MFDFVDAVRARALRDGHQAPRSPAAN
jgi:hypothetical protein